jgi:two-component system, chemotaxis family, chemotaxis protein CheY
MSHPSPDAAMGRGDAMRKVLVIDDSERVRQQVKLALAPAGYDVLEAMDGVDGLERLREHADLLLALCDVNMPRMNGLEMIDRVKQQGLATPIIMLTTEGQPSLIRRARDSGAKGWIVKPFKAALLLAAVQKVAPR